MELTDLDLECSFDILMLYGVRQGCFLTHRGALSVSFLGSTSDSYFIYYLQPRPVITFPREKTKNIFLLQSFKIDHGRIRCTRWRPTKLVLAYSNVVIKNNVLLQNKNFTHMINQKGHRERRHKLLLPRPMGMFAHLSGMSSGYSCL